MVRINYEVPDDLHRRVKVAAVAAGMTLREAVLKGLLLVAEELEAGQEQRGRS